jgi:hypothetical protein
MLGYLLTILDTSSWLDKWSLKTKYLLNYI